MVYFTQLFFWKRVWKWITNRIPGNRAYRAVLDNYPYLTMVVIRNTILTIQKNRQRRPKRTQAWTRLQRVLWTNRYGTYYFAQRTWNRLVISLHLKRIRIHRRGGRYTCRNIPEFGTYTHTHMYAHICIHIRTHRYTYLYATYVCTRSTAATKSSCSSLPSLNIASGW